MKQLLYYIYLRRNIAWNRSTRPTWNRSVINEDIVSEQAKFIPIPCTMIVLTFVPRQNGSRIPYNLAKTFIL